MRPRRKKCGGKEDSSDQQEEKHNDGRDDIIVESLLKLSLINSKRRCEGWRVHTHTHTQISRFSEQLIDKSTDEPWSVNPRLTQTLTTGSNC